MVHFCKDGSTIDVIPQTPEENITMSPSVYYPETPTFDSNWAPRVFAIAAPLRVVPLDVAPRDGDTQGDGDPIDAGVQATSGVSDDERSTAATTTDIAVQTTEENVIASTLVGERRLAYARECALRDRLEQLEEKNTVLEERLAERNASMAIDAGFPLKQASWRASSWGL